MRRGTAERSGGGRATTVERVPQPAEKGPPKSVLFYPCDIASIYRGDFSRPRACLTHPQQLPGGVRLGALVVEVAPALPPVIPGALVVGLDRVLAGVDPLSEPRSSV